MPASNIRITVTGLDAAMKRVDPKRLRKNLVGAMNDSVLSLEAQMKEYPPQRQNTTYRRQYILGKAWTKKVETTASNIIGKVGNKTPYAPWVQSERFQAWMHRGHWRNTDMAVLRASLPKIRGLFQSALDRL